MLEENLAELMAGAGALLSILAYSLRAHLKKILMPGSVAVDKNWSNLMDTANKMDESLHQLTVGQARIIERLDSSDDRHDAFANMTNERLNRIEAFMMRQSP